MQGIDTDSTIKQLIYAYKGANSCAKERGDFALCRATPAGKLGDPELCEGKTANFLQCYHDMVNQSKANCSRQYTNIFKCLKEDLQREDSTSCKELMEEFSRCQ